jgi:hypothetical protein
MERKGRKKAWKDSKGRNEQHDKMQPLNANIKFKFPCGCLFPSLLSAAHEERGQMPKQILPPQLSQLNVADDAAVMRRKVLP